MNRPQKKPTVNSAIANAVNAGYNVACDGYEAFLPSKDEIKELIYSLFEAHRHNLHVHVHKELADEVIVTLINRLEI